MFSKVTSIKKKLFIKNKILDLFSNKKLELIFVN